MREGIAVTVEWRVIFVVVMLSFSTCFSSAVLAQDAEGDNPIVEDKVDPRKHIGELDWTDEKPWSGLRNSWFQNDLLWPFYDEVKSQDFSLKNQDYQALIKGIAYLSWKSTKDHFTAEFVLSLKNEKKLSSAQIEQLFKSIEFEPAQKKLRRDYAITTGVSKRGQDSGNEQIEKADLSKYGSSANSRNAKKGKGSLKGSREKSK